MPETQPEIRRRTNLGCPDSNQVHKKMKLPRPFQPTAGDKNVLIHEFPAIIQ
jgi:hypothetical protein